MNATKPLVGIAMLTWNRLPLLKRALPALLRSLSVPTEVVIFDNGSTDGSQAYLAAFRDRYYFPNVTTLTIKLNETNLGTAAYNIAFSMLTAPVLIEVDDDVVFFPEHWDRKLIAALTSGNNIGYVSTDVVQDEWTNGNRSDGTTYVTTHETLPDGGTLEVGVVGGWCAATPRELFQRLGGFILPGKGRFELEDGVYANRLFKLGLRFAIRTDVKVYHACGAKIAKALGIWDNWYEKYDPATDPLYRIVRDFGVNVQVPPKLPDVLQWETYFPEIISNLAREEKLLDRFIRLLDRQQLHLVEGRMGEFERLASEQEHIIVRIAQLEEKRRELLNRIAIVLGVKDNDISIDRLVSQSAGQCESDWRQLLNQQRSYRRRIGSLSGEVRERLGDRLLRNTTGPSSRLAA